MKNILDKENPKVIAIVLKGEPITLGHLRLFQEASVSADYVNIYFGGSNEPVSPEYPFKIPQRMEMAKPFLNQSRFSMIALPNIQASTKEEWVLSIFEATKKINRFLPTHFLSGDRTNLDWYEGVCNPYNTKQKLETILLDRTEVNLMSGTEIRKQLITGSSDESWKNHVPYLLIDYIQENFPKELTDKFKREMIQKYGDRELGLRKASEALDYLNLDKDIKKEIDLDTYLKLNIKEQFELKNKKD